MGVVCLPRALGLLTLVALWAGSAAVPYNSMYPFGLHFNGSQQLPKDNEEASSGEIPLRVAINFYGTIYNSIFVNTNGLLSFLTDIPVFLNVQFPLDYPCIAPFYANVDTRGSGTVYYHETDDIAALQTAAERVRRSFSTSNFQPTSVFVATWDRVGYYNMGSDKVNTFQVAVSSDGTQSFVELLYADKSIQWVQGSPRGQGLPDARAQGGFVSGDGRSYLLRGSGTDHIMNLVKWSNVQDPGMFIYQIGPTVNDNIVQPDSSVDYSIQHATCFEDETVCHSRASCVESGDAPCCACQKGFFGNGVSCLPHGNPLRVNGKVSGMVNDVNLTGLDLQSYVLVEDGRSYTALSLVPPELGADLQLLSPIAMSIGFLFAKPAAAGAPNGFSLTGGEFTHTLDQFFPQSGERLSLTLRYLGLDVFDQLRLEVEAHGAVPSIPPDAKMRMEDHEELFQRLGPGALHSTSQQAYSLDDSNLQTRFTVEQRIEFSECGQPEWERPAQPQPGHSENAIEGSGSGASGATEAPAGAPGPVLKVKSSVSLISYEQREGIVRFAPSTKVTNRLEDTDPCEEGRAQCGPNSVCVVTEDAFECQCTRGYQKIYSEVALEHSIEECMDINECQSGISGCSANATCYNLQGSYSCECKPGYVGDGRSCELQRTCAELGCDPNAFCTGNVCQCQPDFEGNGYRCSPIGGSRPGFEPIPSQPDYPYGPPGHTGVPCTGPEHCSPFGACVTDEQTGAHSCACLPGYGGDGVECEAHALEPSCDSEGNCQCVRGYVLDAGVCLPSGDVGLPVTDISEQPPSCHEFNNCHPHAQCVYVQGLAAYRCVCSLGYVGDGWECSSGNAGSCLELQNCHHFGECVLLETEDRYECRCRHGYRGDGRDFCEAERQEPAGCDVTRDCHPEANCVPVGRRYQCVCVTGFQGDGHSCERVAPPGCEVLHDCGRHAECLRLHGEVSHRCQCLPGFYGDGYHCEPERQVERPRERLMCGPSGNRPCSEKDTDFMVVAQGMALMRVPLLPPQTASQAGQPLQIHYQQEAIGIDVDCDQQRIYWGDVGSKSIKSAFYNGTNVTAFLDTGIGSPEGIAVDWASRNIYWTDSSKDTIEVASLDTRGRYTVVRDGLVNPRGIAVHPQRGKLFWSDWDRKGPKLEWANLDGSGREPFLQGNAVQLPNSLAIDFERDELCWADAGTKSIECIGISNGLRRTVVANCTYPFGLTMSEDNYYWTDWESHKVESASRPHGAARPAKDVPLGGSGKMYGLVVVPEQCRQMRNHCSWQRGYCNPDQLCLPVGEGQQGRRCVCPENQPCDEE